MFINRRRLLSMLAVTSAAAMGQSKRLRLFRPLLASPPLQPVSLLFHGFFFFDVQNKPGDQALVVAAPFYKFHNFLQRDNGANQLDPIPKQVLDLRNVLTGTTQMPTWPRSILNFPKAGILDDQTLTRTWSGALGCLLLLPLPLSVSGKRFGGDITDFNMSGNIAQLIAKSSGATLNLITQLDYQSASFKSHHFHAEHCDVPNDDEIAEMLNTARNAFGGKFQQKFDLKMTGIPLTSASTAANDDEANLPDLAGLKGNPCRPLPITPGLRKQRAEASSRMTKAEQLQEHEELVRTANCPMFGMT